MSHVLILGAGGLDIQLSRLYPKLKFVVQDRGPVLEQGEHTVWPKENPQALADGRVTFMQHDFFDVNPVKDADVYWLRYIMSVTPYNNCFCFSHSFPSYRPLLTSRPTISHAFHSFGPQVVPKYPPNISNPCSAMTGPTPISSAFSALSVPP